MSNEKQKDKALKPSSIFVPIDWGTHVRCEKCGDEIKRGLANYTEHYFQCNGAKTEDATFKILEPKQLPSNE